jgi:hypothetical protein
MAEFSVLIDKLAILFGKEACRMVEHRPKLIQRFPCMDAPVWRDWAASLDLYAEVSKIRAELIDDTIVFTLNDRGMFMIDSCNVTVCGN